MVRCNCRGKLVQLAAADMHGTINRTLIIRFSSVGDIVLSSLLLRVLRRRFPHCQIDYLVKAEFGDLVRHNPYVSRVIQFPTGGTFAELTQLRKRIKSTDYDLIVDIHDSLRSRYLCFGAKQFVRINKRKITRFLLVKTKLNLYSRYDNAPSVADRYLETIKKFGIVNDGKGLEIHIPEHTEERILKFLIEAGVSTEKLLIGICPSAKHQNKTWLKDRFAETAVALASENDGSIVLLGSKEEEARCNEIEQLIHKAAPETLVVNVAGKISLNDTAAIMDRCIIIVTNDSGLMHIAAARKRKVVAIFGPTVREFGFFPYGTESSVVENTGLSCRPCTHIGLPTCPKGHFKCMNDIPTSHVIESARRLLRS